MNQFNYETARKARIQLGLTQKDVANDLNKESQGFLTLNNTKLSRYERGDSALDNTTQKFLKDYYEKKIEETNTYEPEQYDREPKSGSAARQDTNNFRNGDNRDFPNNADETQTIEGRVSPLVEKSEKLSAYDLIRFDPKVTESAKSVLFDMFQSLVMQLEEGLEQPVKRGVFGSVSEDTAEGARSCVYAMAGLYNIIRALQGKPVLPIKEDSEKLDEDDILSVIQESFKYYTGQGPNPIAATG